MHAGDVSSLLLVNPLGAESLKVLGFMDATIREILVLPHGRARLQWVIAPPHDRAELPRMLAPPHGRSRLINSNSTIRYS